MVERRCNLGTSVGFNSRDPSTYFTARQNTYYQVEPVLHHCVTLASFLVVLAQPLGKLLLVYRFLDIALVSTGQR
jgi:hypothetical protein